MTDEEVQALIDEVSREIQDLSGDRALSKDERRHKDILLLQKDLLKRLREAKAKGDIQTEARVAMDYSLMKELGEKHPYLLYLIKAQSGWSLL